MSKVYKGTNAIGTICIITFIMHNGLLYRYLTDMHRNNFVASHKGVLVGLHTQPFLCHFNDTHFEGVSIIEFRGSILQSYLSYVSNDKHSYCYCLGYKLEFGYKEI